MAAIERKDGGIKRVWIPYHNKLKGIRLAFVRIAALEEVESDLSGRPEESRT